MMHLTMEWCHLFETTSQLNKPGIRNFFVSDARLLSLDLPYVDKA